MNERLTDCCGLEAKDQAGVETRVLLQTLYSWSAEHSFSLAHRARMVSPRFLLGWKELLRSIEAVGYWSRKESGSAQFWQLLPLEGRFHHLRDNLVQRKKAVFLSISYTSFA